MRNLMVLFMSFMLASCLRNLQPMSTTGSDLKVLSWNICHRDKYESYSEKGRQGTLGVLSASGADVILMGESYDAERHIADSLGFFHTTLSENLSILSRYPITEVYKFDKDISTLNFGGVCIDKNGRKIRLFNIWLDDQPDISLVPTTRSSEKIVSWEKRGTRDDEIAKILRALKPFMKEANDIPIIVGGDFNSHSHLDWTEETKYMFHHNGAVVDWPISKAMVEKGFVDSFREKNPDPITNIGITWMYADSCAIREDRIDYIYYQGLHLEVAESDSYYTRLGNDLYFKGNYYYYASDHGFVLTTFRLK